MRAPKPEVGTILTLRGVEVIATSSRPCGLCIAATEYMSPVGRCHDTPMCYTQNDPDGNIAFVPVEKYIVLRMKGEL